MDHLRSGVSTVKTFLNALVASAAFLLPALPASAQGPSAATTKSEAAFKQLTSLVGDWEGVEDGTPFRVSYTLSGAGTALMERVRPGDPQATVTMFTVDGDHLIATHYCVVGNQPQM